jgi:hypothetical protein
MKHKDMQLGAVVTLDIGHDDSVGKRHVIVMIDECEESWKTAFLRQRDNGEEYWVNHRDIEQIAGPSKAECGARVWCQHRLGTIVSMSENIARGPIVHWDDADTCEFEHIMDRPVAMIEPALRVGDAVRHKHKGLGEVKEIKNELNSPTCYTVDFPSLGETAFNVAREKLVWDYDTNAAKPKPPEDAKFKIDDVVNISTGTRGVVITGQIDRSWRGKKQECYEVRLTEGPNKGTTVWQNAEDLALAKDDPAVLAKKLGAELQSAIALAFKPGDKVRHATRPKLWGYGTVSKVLLLDNIVDVNWGNKIHAHKPSDLVLASTLKLKGVDPKNRYKSGERVSDTVDKAHGTVLEKGEDDNGFVNIEWDDGARSWRHRDYLMLLLGEAPKSQTIKLEIDGKALATATTATATTSNMGAWRNGALQFFDIATDEKPPKTKGKEMTKAVFKAGDRVVDKRDGWHGVVTELNTEENNVQVKWDTWIPFGGPIITWVCLSGGHIQHEPEGYRRRSKMVRRLFRIAFWPAFATWRQKKVMVAMLVAWSFGYYFPVIAPHKAMLTTVNAVGDVASWAGGQVGTAFDAVATAFVADRSVPQEEQDDRAALLQRIAELEAKAALE